MNDTEPVAMQETTADECEVVLAWSLLMWMALGLPVGVLAAGVGGGMLGWLWVVTGFGVWAVFGVWATTRSLRVFVPLPDKR